MYECLLQSAHNRLNECHRAWHGALDGYQSAEEFRADLNTAIQALRNVTFALQARKDPLSGFDDWYKPWQEQMKKDDVMKWLHKARNFIVKKGDLETKSVAHASVMTWEKLALVELEFNPLVDIQELVARIIQFNLLKVPKEIEENAILTVERKWMTEDLPEKELLEVISQGFSFLYRLLTDAHNVFNLENTRCFTDNLHTRFKVGQNSIPECMKISTVDRSITIHLRDKEVMCCELSEISLIVDHIRVLKRYPGLVENARKKSDLGSNKGLPFPFNKMDMYVETAKTLLQRDKTHGRYSFLYRKEGQGPKTIAHEEKDPQEKFATAQRIVEEIIKKDVIGVIDVGEAWLVQQKHLKRNERPSQSKHRKEALFISCATANTIKYITIPFKRSFLGKIEFQKMHIEEADASNNSYYFLNPIIGALKKVAKQS